MSAGNEDQCVPTPLIESSKKSKVSYTREFLISLSELDICKKLPSGFDQSILSNDFEDASNSIPEWSGSLSSQSFRRGEYGSSPPIRGDVSHYSRGIHGRWDSRSAGLNDKDAELQSDWESDSGRRYGNQSKHSWQNPEHDGLLGSGAFPRTSGYTAGSSAPKVRGNGHYQLNKSNEPYQPPRPYKAVPHSRRDTTDLINDETFGSTDCSSLDRAEEEKKRRASFELLRKEQHKAFQEKQKQFPDKHKENVDPDIAALLEVSEDNKKLSDKCSGLENVAPPVSQSDYAKCPFPAQTTVSRPRVPPGFASTCVEKNLVTKSLTPLTVSEVGTTGLEDNITHIKGDLMANGIPDNQLEKKLAHVVDSGEQQYEIKSVHIPCTDIDIYEKMATQSSDVEVSDKLVGVVSGYKTSNLSKDYEGLGDDEIKDFDTGKVPGHEIMTTNGQEHSTTILEKLFGHALTENSSGSSGFIEHSDTKVDGTGGSILVKSSKFNHWFLKEEKDPVYDSSSGKPKDLLSLIVSGEKAGSQVSDVKPLIFPLKSNELQQFIASPATPVKTGIDEPLYKCNRSDTTLGVLTCEDLEQSILSGISENSASLQHSVQAWSALDAKARHSKTEIDNHASQHLLSLLQKGTNSKTASSPNLDVTSSENLLDYEVGTVRSACNNSREGNEEKVNSEKTLTLETLFGTTFMNELHSVEAPVSVQRGSIGGATRTNVSKPRGLPISVVDDGFFPSTISEYGSNRTTQEGDIHASNHLKEIKSNEREEHWLGYDIPQTEVGGKLNAVGGFKDTADGASEIRLPEEESLISMGDPANSQYSMFMPVENATKAQLFSSSNMPVDIVDKLAALNAVLKEERSMIPGQDGIPFLSGLCNPVEPEIPYPNLQVQPSSPQFPHLQMNHGRPSFQPFDAHHAHVNPQIKFMSPESITHPEPPPHHHFSSSIFHRPPFRHALGGPTRFNPPAHHAMLHNIHMPGNFPPHHVRQGMPRLAPPPTHHINHTAGYTPEMNSMQDFPSSHWQPSYGGLETPMPAPGISSGGSNHPEAFEKLIEMELRANLKQMHPITGTAPSSGSYGHEVDMGFKYR